MNDGEVFVTLDNKSKVSGVEMIHLIVRAKKEKELNCID